MLRASDDMPVNLDVVSKHVKPTFGVLGYVLTPGDDVQSRMSYADWIRRGLARPGKTRSGLAKAAGVHVSQVTHWLAGRRHIKAHQLERIARYLELAPPAAYAETHINNLPLSNNAYIDPGHASVTYVPIVGETAAGIWREEDVTPQLTDAPTIPVIPLDYPVSQQFAYRVIGNSMNKRRIWDGDYVVCVPYFEKRAELTEGDLVVVQRRDGHLVERTLKIIHVTPTGYELQPSSTEPGHKTITIPRNFEPEDGVEIEVVGFAVGRYAPL